MKHFYLQKKIFIRSSHNIDQTKYIFNSHFSLIYMLGGDYKGRAQHPAISQT